ncbi:MAG: hypothetical protein GY796_20420 [Chloroflexi bacterium]|nr:hypothetical protein [Chloroflexota bacterium]
MPIYTYKCRECEYQFDQRQRMADDPIVECPSCAELQLRKVINSAGIVFKGSGFYVTDNRNGSSKAKTANGTSSKEPDTKSESSTSAKESKKKKPAKKEKSAVTN